MKQLKTSMEEAGVKPEKTVFTSPNPLIKNSRLPVSRLIARLSLGMYDRYAPLDEKPVSADRVRIPVKMHIGAPSVCTAAVGSRVKKGDLIAEIPDGKPGARVHASIDGLVTSIGDTIEIVKQ